MGGTKNERRHRRCRCRPWHWSTMATSLSPHILSRLRTITLVQRAIVAYDVPSIVVEHFKVFARRYGICYDVSLSYHPGMGLTRTVYNSTIH